MRISVLLALGALSWLPMVSFLPAASAQDACICEISLETSAPGPVASLQDVAGEVLLAGAHGYAPVQSDAGLSIGDRVVLLQDGRAVLVAGPACRVALGPESTISLIPSDAGVCVARAIASQPAYDPVPALVGAGLTAGGMAAIILLSKDGAPPLPISP